jgi:hypothetical protein
MSALMSPAKAEKWLGMKHSDQGRALLRLALRREEELGKRFVVRRGFGKGLRYLFSRVAIRKHMPELLEDRFERTARRVEETVQRVKEELNDIIDERIEHHPLIQTLDKRSIETIGLVESLAEQVERCVGHGGTRRNTAA